MYGEEPAPDPVLTSRDERDIEKSSPAPKNSFFLRRGWCLTAIPLPRKPSIPFFRQCRSVWNSQKRRTKKNTHRKNIKRTDVYGHKKRANQIAHRFQSRNPLKLSVDWMWFSWMLLKRSPWFLSVFSEKPYHLSRWNSFRAGAHTGSGTRTWASVSP